MTRKTSIFLLTVSSLCFGFATLKAPSDQQIPPEDSRLTHFSSLKSLYSKPEYSDRDAWMARALNLRQHILISSGLWPFPVRTPLNQHIFGRIERKGYSVEKVYFESYPGLYVVGNLYRPVGKTGPFPGILSPHGHWDHGRFEDTEIASVPGRAINFALQGYVVFSYSMLGFNESKLQMPHGINGAREALWGISSMGIQLWNSIRSLDFLTSLSDVDPARIGVTGASGGGTQTFMLSAVDNRVQVAAPVNMISLHFQGGCTCENTYNLRINSNNVEIGALMAPRPLLMVSTSGDWTNETPRVEFPAIRSIYSLLGAEDQVSNAHFNYGHNYNKDSREAVYGWFARWLQPQNKSLKTLEVPFQVERTEDLEVFRKLPDGAVDRQKLTEYLVELARQALHSKLPRDWSQLHEYRRLFGSAYRDLMGVTVPSLDRLLVWSAEEGRIGDIFASRLYLGRRGTGDRVPAVFLSPTKHYAAMATLVVDGKGLRSQVEGFKPLANSLTEALLAKGHSVLIIDPFPGGFAYNQPKDLAFFTTYNRAAAVEAVQDILTGVAALQRQSGIKEVRMVGLGDAGLIVLLAGALTEDAGVVASDVDGFDNRADDAFIQRLNVPLLRRAGDLTTAAALVVPRRLVLFNTGVNFDSEGIITVFRTANAGDLLAISPDAQSVDAIVANLSR